MKRVLIVMMLIAMVLPTIVMPASAQDEVTIEVYITGLTEDTMTWFEDVAFPAFEAENPGVNMEIITGGWGDFDVSVAGWITTGEGPDIVYLGSEYSATYGDLLTDISPYVEEWEDLDQFLPAALNTATWDGSLRGLPLLMSPRPVFYRADLQDGDIPATFGDAVDFAAANSIVEEGAIVQQGYMDIGNGLFDAQEFIGLIWAAGGELYNDDGSSAFDSAATAEVLQFMYDRRRAVLPAEDVATLPQFEGFPITSEQVVSGIFPMWNMPPVGDEIWENIEIAPYPAGENGAPVVQVFTDWLSVPAYSENPEIAVDFLKFITSEEYAIALNEVAGFTPTRVDAWDQIRANSAVWDTMLGLAEEYGRGFSDIRASAELRPLVVEQVTLFLTDQQSLEDTQQFLKEEYDLILEEGGYLN